MSVCCPVSVLMFSSKTILKALCSQTRVVCAADSFLGLGFPRRVPLQVVYCKVWATSVGEWGSETSHGGPQPALRARDRGR